MEHSDLYIKIGALPGELKSEVSDFIDFLIKKKKKTAQKKTPRFGCAKWQIFMSPDFDELLYDFKDYS